MSTALRESSDAHWHASHTEQPIQRVDGSVYVPAKALNIVWGNDDRFWKWMTVENDTHGSKTVAALVQVSYIGVYGKIDMSTYLNSFSSTKYEIYWRIKFNVDAFGWDSSPIKFFAATCSNDQKRSRSEMLHKYTNQTDKWHEIFGGEVIISSNSPKKLVEFGMFETESNKWKGSLLLAGVIFKPKA